MFKSDIFLLWHSSLERAPVFVIFQGIYSDSIASPSLYLPDWVSERRSPVSAYPASSYFASSELFKFFLLLKYGGKQPIHDEIQQLLLSYALQSHIDS